MQCDIVLLFSVSLNFFLMQLLLVWFGVPCSTDLGYSFCGLVWFGILLMYVFAVFADQSTITCNRYYDPMK